MKILLLVSDSLLFILSESFYFNLNPFDLVRSFTDYAEPMDLLKKISRNVLLNYASKEEVAFETLWQERACVVTFLRRFG